MRTIVIGVALACLAAPATRAEVIEYTDAISRPMLMLNTRSVEYTDAISRQSLMIDIRQGEYADAATRQTHGVHGR